MASRSTSTARVADLERRLVEAEAARAAAETARIEAETRLAAVEEARARLERLLSQMRRDTYGAKSEKGDPDQHHLPFEDIEAAAGMLAAASEAAEKVIGTKKAPMSPPQRNKGNLPAHLPRIEQVIEPENILCPCGCGAMQRVGESRAERLDPPRANSPPDCSLILVDPSPIPRAGDGAPEIRLPDLLRGAACPGSGTGMVGAAWPADRGAGGALHGRQIWRLPAVLPSGGYLSPPRARS